MPTDSPRFVDGSRTPPSRGTLLWCVGGALHASRHAYTSEPRLRIPLFAGLGDDPSGLPLMGGEYWLVGYEYTTSCGREVLEHYWIHDQFVAGGRPVFDLDNWPLLYASDLFGGPM